jgi:hypothetical protein
MKKRKFAAGGYLPNYGDEQNPFTPTIINPEGQDMSLPAMGNPDDPYQGYRHGGKVKMKPKKMAEGGPTPPTTPFTRPDRSGIDRADRGIDANKAARQALVARGLRSGENINEDILAHPNAANIMANRLAFKPLGLARRTYNRTTPDYDNYRAFYGMEKAKFKDAMGGDSFRPRADTSVGKYTAGTYNPATNYGAIAQQQDAAADAAKKAAKKEFEAARKPATKMAKGGMASSASKRGDGCAMRGKTKCKMR